MKKLITNYTFDKSALKITFNDYAEIELERVLLVTNVKRQTQLYIFSANNNSLAIQNNLYIGGSYPTFMWSDTDELLIYYDDPAEPAYDASIQTTNNLTEALYEVARKLDFLNAVRGISADLRVSPLSTPNMSTLSTLSNLASFSGWGTATMVKDFDNLTAINSNINNIA